MRVLLALGFVAPFFALAHEGEEHSEEIVIEVAGFWERLFWSDILLVVYAASALIAFLVLIVLLRRPKGYVSKVLFFALISFVVVLTTIYIAGATIYQNLTSATRGPAHWHADFRIFNCEQELNLVSPEGIANRVGIPEVHEHGDGRIHIEGKIKHLQEASLHGFFDAVGGTLTKNKLTIPTDKGLINLQNGNICPDGDIGALQVFLWKTLDGQAEQIKLSNFPDYVISPQSAIPPGDCVIIEFGPEKEKTENICFFYEIASNKGDLKLIQ